MSVETNRPLQKSDSVQEEEERVSRAANRLSEIRLVLLGWRWPGKSLTGNTILGREEFHLERAAEFCVTRRTEAEGRRVTVVDTPGWFASQATPPSYREEIRRGASLCPPGPHAFLLVVPVGMFSEADRARIEEHMGLFGERVWRHTIVVFTWAEVLKTISIERYIRREGGDLQWVLDRCKRRYFVVNNYVFGDHPQLARLLETVERLVAEEGGLYHPGEGGEGEGEKKPPLHENRNHAESQPQEGRQLGARPKQNSALSLAKPAEVPSPNN